MAEPTPWRLPDGFRFGVATAGFQVEGGYNGPGQPANHWISWERQGRVEPSGIALDFWHRYEEQLDAAAAAGCDSIRLSVEWTRVEPEEGAVDHGALDHYGRILDAAVSRRLTPLVTLHHFTHPAWLGVDFWLRPDAPRRFEGWVRRAVDALGDRCRNWVTINELNILAVETYLTGSFPPGRVADVASAVTALDHLLAAHVVAYDAVHALQPEAVVATNNYALSVYEFDRLPMDLLVARGAGVPAAALPGWLAGLRRLAGAALPIERALPTARAAIAAARSERLLDVAQVDHYDPVAAHHLRWPGHRTAGGRRFEPSRALWDDPPSPSALTARCALAADDAPTVWVVENGLCNRVRRGRSYPRLDGWDRPRYLREHLAAVVAAIDAGVAVTGYWHWTLADNYEWGSYEPRFGLHGVDRERGLTWSPLDAMGGDAAGAYRRLADGLRAGDRSVLDEAVGR